MKHLKRFLCFLLTAAMLLSMHTIGFAAENDTGYTDVSADAWYAGAVQYVRNNGLMSGTDTATFSPNATTSRGMLATILYRAAGSPAAIRHSFTDIPAGIWYEDAAAWANGYGIMSGYGDGRFGGDDPVTREQLVTIFWRYAGAPDAGSGTDFADETSISAYAATAVDWSRANNIINGKEGNFFDPKGTATRAETATILRNYMTANPMTPQPSAPQQPVVPQQPDPTTETPSTTTPQQPETSQRPSSDNNQTTSRPSSSRPSSGSNRPSTPSRPSTPEPAPTPTPTPTSDILVVYFSASNNTERVAGYIADALNADQFELIPVEPYTSADLNWTTPGSRVNREHDDPSLRDIELVSTTTANWDSYDTVFIGYPIWWGIAAWPTDTFVKANDFTGKTVIPFCTSSSSGLGQSGELLAEMAGTGDWQEGQRFRSSASRTDVQQWIDSLNLEPSVEGDTALTIVPTPSARQTIYLWEAGNMPGVTEYTVNAVKAAGVPVEQLELDGFGHGFGTRGDWIEPYSAWLTNIFANN